MDKKTVVISTQPIAKNNHSLFVSVIGYLKKVIPNLVVLDKDFDSFTEDIDNIIIAYGTFYADIKPIMRFLEYYKDKRFFYLVCEYGIVPNGDIYQFLIKHNYEIIANYAKNSLGAKHHIDFHFINLNALVYENILNVPFSQKTENIIYWGRYRPDRKIYFDKYFSDITLCTSDKNVSLFRDYPINIIKSLPFTEFSPIQKYKYTLYIEDEYTHTHYHNLGARFYEALSLGLIMFFDINCKNTIELSNYNIPDFYIVNSRKEIEEKIKQIEQQPLKYLSDIEILRKRAIEEQKNTLIKLQDILETRTIKPKYICKNCNIISYYLTNCSSCNTVICPSCLEIHKKFYCLKCYSLLNLNKTQQLTFD